MITFLEDAGIKLSAVVSDITGRSARAMLEALVAGERDPAVLCEPARGSMRRKRPELTRALTGHFTDHHAFMVATMLRAIDDAEHRIAALGQEIDRQLQPYRHQVEPLITIPGISLTVAQVVIAEIGVDMHRFATAGHLASWAGVCPGNNESAGKQKSGRTRHGDAWLKGALGVAAAGATRSKNTYLAAQYRHLVGHRGKGRALVAVGHSILVAAWHVLANDISYQDRGPDHFTRRLGKARQTRRLTAQLTTLGYQASLNPTQPAT